MNDPRSVVVADDHPLFRKGLVEVLRESGVLNVVGEAANGESALTLIETHAPDVAVLDIEMPRMGGLEVAGKVRDKGLGTAVVLLTMHRSRGMLERALQNGVRGYVIKDNAATDIVNCLHLVMAGGTYISPGIETGSVRPAPLAEQAATAKGLARLTPAERRVLRLIAEGRTSPAIATSLGISPKTVEHHRSNICGKLEISGMNALVRFAVEHRALLD
jgi:DNA-binding NarL/FixJ family response regulator